ncbi:HD-GYP domain-containing protein [Sphingomonas sp. ABOLD]|uniref:Putative nucleotidyltransferase with HDIG domain n=1 Tax=Sphingomonas trueperi TaxID=53317 RepID=A0A7X5XY35_9SPHN|nr:MULTISPECIES: HD-GYP domain-containing protein [Sphingomonas]NJB97466.1 putative nucleotidyltransferase with HDIG domain [Sphingomonas trueperi]RSV43222.1 HD-GYP domain-containing protein [Sphingomonas sp. ABOLE]RSV45913.1 HD-GYP domain-containing protein [Sphingomonas sp. ABOLD]
MAALRTVPAAEVRLGMFIHGFEGSWWEHPFWRTRFLLTETEDLQKLRAFRGGVIIDVARSQATASDGDTPAIAVRDGNEADAPATWSAARAKRPLPESPAARFSADQAEAAALVAGALDTVRGTFDDVRLGRAVAHEKVAALVDDIAGQLDRNASALLRVLQLKSKHQYTYLHSVAVCTLMVNLARHLAMDEEAVRTLGLAGLLHDVGKVAIPDAVLDKPGRLSAEEFALVRTHPEEGVALLREDGAMPALAVEVCLHHHERWDGNGYPHGLKADDISLPARMGAICDVYDALTSHRAYKRAWLPAQALGAMWSWDGHFDRELLFQFMRSINLYPPGMLVRLASDRLALVLENGERATRTRLLVFHSFAEGAALPPRTLVLSAGTADDKVVGFVRPEEAPSAIPALDLYPPVAVTN